MGFQTKQLTDLERAVLYDRRTEPPFSGKYDSFFPRTDREKGGHFQCKACENPLFPASAKFNAGCGWPAFDQCYIGSVETVPDGGRTEIVCGKCRGHLGHVFFQEGFTATNQRHCVNSVSIQFIENPVNTSLMQVGLIASPTGP